MISEAELPPKLEGQEVPALSISSQQDEECLIITCAGPSNCRNCIDMLYRPIMNKMEDSDYTGLVIDKRQILCSRETKSINLIAETILHYSHRALLRKIAIVTTIEYKKNEQLLLQALYQKGVNIRLFTELEPAVQWAKTYP
ncbi:hypothetical protein [Pelovirga terrestris]|uniref:Uncharacterized protein n=1 Tax=Pelovirga terrestris TaxID=2771352 RepID=A0A8J6QQ19_9BACT|nr:hypothetical protein [Pelovirga terrestris]MBD1400358.1 hypothetical protein [Pelovirga terrestris]